MENLNTDISTSTDEKILKYSGGIAVGLFLAIIISSFAIPLIAFIIPVDVIKKISLGFLSIGTALAFTAILMPLVFIPLIFSIISFASAKNISKGSFLKIICIVANISVIFYLLAMIVEAIASQQW